MNRSNPRAVLMATKPAMAMDRMPRMTTIHMPMTTVRTIIRMCTALIASMTIDHTAVTR